MRRRRLGAAPRTLLHGDLRLDNVLWRPPVAPVAPPQTRYIDMGGARTLCRRGGPWLPSVRACVTEAAAPRTAPRTGATDCAAGRGAFDVGYFLSMSLEPEVRRSLEASLLQEYVAALAAGGVRGYGLDAARRDYRDATAYALCLAVNLGGAPALDAAPPRKRALAAAVARRIAAAVADAGPGALLP
jgi:hypothetical protein